MKRTLLVAGLLTGLVATTVNLSSAAERPVSRLDGSCHLAVAKPYEWVGSCQIRCADGSCKVTCGGGVVFATDDFQAKLMAEIGMKQQASTQGIPVEGTVTITFTGHFGR